jgi:hypothetical protein
MDSYIRKVICIFLTMLLISCSDAGPTTKISNIGTPTSSEGATAIYQPTILSTPTKPMTISRPSLTPIIKESPTSSVFNNHPEEGLLTTDCIDINQRVSTYSETTGVIVFGNTSEQSLSLLNLSTRKTIDLPRGKDMHLRYPSVSHDFKNLAYKEDNTVANLSKLIIVTADGKPIKSIAWKPDWLNIIGWADDVHLWIAQRQGYPAAMALYNLSTDTSQVFLSNYPEIYLSAPPYLQWSGNSVSGTIYDQSRTRVFYFSAQENKYFIVLRDLQNDKELLRQQIGNFGGHTPIWSPDGMQVVGNFVLDDQGILPSEDLEDLYAVTKDGSIHPLTNFSRHFEKSVFAFSNWSPNGDSVAFLINLQPYQYPFSYPDQGTDIFYRLGILDLNTLNTTNYCLPGENSYPPIWSPNGNEIAISYHYSATPPVKSHAYIFNIAQKAVIRIGEDVIPQGWMILP